MRRHLLLAALVALVAMTAAGCGGPHGPAKLDVGGPGSSFLCNPMLLGSEQYWSQWEMSVPDKTPVILSSVHLVPVGRQSPMIEIVGYYAQPRDSMSMAGQQWAGPKVGVTDVLGLPGGETFAQSAGLRVAPGTTVAVGVKVLAGVVLRANGPGVRTWSGMDLIYHDKDSTVTRTVFESIGLQVRGGVKTLPTRNCPDQAAI